MTNDLPTAAKICLQCRKEFGAENAFCPEDGALLVVPQTGQSGEDPFIGTVLSERYEINSIAGKGGMGIVYKGRHLLLDRNIAIKVLRSDLVSDERSYLRFQVEAVAASKLDHPNVLSVHDYGVAPSGQPFLVMDFIEGNNLSNMISDDGHVDYRRALPIFIQACNALEHAHQHDIIHRDVKPSNMILVQTEGQPDLLKIVDFGIAQLGMLADEGLRLTKTGEIFGSPMYMSPEQCLAEPLDKRTDVYSLGVCMYETLTGVPPILGKTAADTIHKKLTEDPRPFKIARPSLSIPEAVESVVLKALEREPRRRFENMHQFKVAIEQAMEGIAVVRRSSTRIQAATTQDFSNVDLKSEIEKASLSADKLKSKAKSAKMLAHDSERDTVPVQVDKLKSTDLPEKKDWSMLVALPAVLLPLLTAVLWFFFLGGNKAFQPGNNEPLKPGTMNGMVISANVANRNKGNFSIQSPTGESIMFFVDNRTQLKTSLKKGTYTRVFYSKKNGKLHADRVVPQ